MSSSRLAAAVLAVAVSAGCASSRMASRSLMAMAPDLLVSFYDEPDYELARQGAMATITLLEAVQRADPGNERGSLLLAEAFGGLAFNFVREDVERASGPGVEVARLRQRELFARGRAHAESALRKRAPAIASALNGDVATLRSELDRQRDAALAAPLFWLAFNWSGEIDAAGAGVTRPRDLPRVRLIAGRASQLNAALLFGAPLMLQASLACGIPASLGGDVEAGRALFERAIAVAGDRLLLARVQRARICAVAEGDRAAFDRDLAAVADASGDTLPGYRLLTTVAKRYARWLGAEAAALFPDGDDDGR